MALELMKFGVLSGEPFDPAEAERPFPSKINYPTDANSEVKSVLLLCRAMSLVPMRLRNDMWNADVNFDLAAFHSLIKVLKRTLRQVTEGCLASLLMADLDLTKLLPDSFMCCTTNKECPLKVPALLPAFPLPRACLGIVSKYFIDYKGTQKQFEPELADA